jgi:hypothetical protein
MVFVAWGQDYDPCVKLLEWYSPLILVGSYRQREDRSFSGS